MISNIWKDIGDKKMTKWKVITSILSVALIVISISLGYLCINYSSDLNSTRKHLSATKITLSETKNKLSQIQDQKEFPDVNALEKWIYTIVSENKDEYLRQYKNGELSIAMYLQKQAALSGYMMSTVSDWFFIDYTTYNPAYASYWFWDVENVVYIGNNVYVIGAGSTTIYVYDVSTNLSIQGYQTPCLMLYNKLWQLDINSLSEST